jgi:hypothetical protein
MTDYKIIAESNNLKNFSATFFQKIAAFAEKVKGLNESA